MLSLVSSITIGDYQTCLSTNCDSIKDNCRENSTYCAEVYTNYTTCTISSSSDCTTCTEYLDTSPTTDTFPTECSNCFGTCGPDSRALSVWFDMYWMC